nr:MAG TPA: hypothetical protein [Caudoviricetes sp.]
MRAILEYRDFCFYKAGMTTEMHFCGVILALIRI